MSRTDVLKKFVPINSLAPANFRELAATAVIEKHPKGQVLFRCGTTDNQTIYLLKGEIELIPIDNRKRRSIAGDTENARYPLAQLKPRQFTGMSKTGVTLAWVASDLLDRLLTWDQLTGGYEVTELEGSEDGEWIMQVLRNKAFQTLPTTSINALFARLEPVSVEDGDAIIKQGESGDYFYIIKQGRCRVSRKSEKSGKVTILDELREGDSFGEEALLSGAPRNATIVMDTNGTLMRLAKRDFDELLKLPLVKWVGLREAKTMLHQGAGLLDVRLEDEHRQSAIRGSINIPLYLLRLKAAGLDPECRYIVYCETGSRSSAAAFLLSERGYDVCVLKGGLVGLRKAVGGRPEAAVARS